MNKTFQSARPIFDFVSIFGLVAFWIVVTGFFPVQNQEQPSVENLKLKNQTLTSDTARISYYLQLSDEYKGINLDSALAYGLKAKALSEESGENYFLVNSLIRLLAIYNTRHELDSANAYYERGLEIAKKLDDSLIFAKLYSKYGSLLMRKTPISSALKPFFKSLSIYKSKNHKKGMAELYNKIGIIYEQTGESDSALYYFINSQTIYHELNDSAGIVRLAINSGKFYFNQEEFEKAREQFISCLPILDKKSNFRYEGNVYNNLGMVYYKLLNLDSSLYYYRKAIEKYKLAKYSSGIANVLLNIGPIYEYKKQYQKALEHYDSALYIFIKLQDLRGETITKLDIAVIYERMGEYDRALQLYDTCLTDARKGQFSDVKQWVLQNISKTYELKGNYKKAFDYQNEYLILHDSIYNKEKADAIATLEQQYDNEKKEKEILILKNKSLDDELQIKKRTNERNILTAVGIILVLILLFLYVFSRQKNKKDRIIQQKEIQRLEEEKRVLAAKSLVEGQEEERKRVARELHDGLGVLLSTVKLHFTSFEDKLKGSRELVKKANDLLNKASGDVRRISHNMMPGVLIKLGLRDALEDLFENISASGKVQAEISIEGLDDRLPENEEIMIYRIIQELVNNTLKHAEATNISLLINKAGEELNIQYSDNGKGFDIDEVEKTASLGIKSIKSRVQFMGGTLTVESGMGKGASFLIYIPLENKQE